VAFFSKDFSWRRFNPILGGRSTARFGIFIQSVHSWMGTRKQGAPNICPKEKTLGCFPEGLFRGKHPGERVLWETNPPLRGLKRGPFSNNHTHSSPGYKGGSYNENRASNFQEGYKGSTRRIQTEEKTRQTGDIPRDHKRVSR